MTSSKQQEKQDNENYSKNFTRVPNIVFVSYKYLTKEEKFLYCTLRQVYWDMKPRFVSLRELSMMTGYSVSALCKMIPRLHTCGLIHAEVRKEKGKDGKEKGNPKYHITIPDIWELNKRYFEASPEEQAKIDPSLKLVHEKEQDLAKPVHEKEQACSPNNTSLFTKKDKTVPFGEQVQAQLERAKDSNKDISKDILERKNAASRQRANVATEQEATHSSMHSSLSQSKNFSSFSSPEGKQEEEVEFSPEEQAIYDFGKKDLFKAKPPTKTAKLKSECAELVPHIKTQEQFDSLLAFVRSLPYIKGQIHIKNLVNGLNGWLQPQEAQSTPSSSRQKPSGPFIAQQPTKSREEIDRENEAQIAKYHARVAAIKAKKQAEKEAQGGAV